uniref:Transporter n=1 Tax=Meloidogyne hapla TaxID=6305 RepID=A0A1I8B3F4_MELHA
MAQSSEAKQSKESVTSSKESKQQKKLQSSENGKMKGEGGDKENGEQKDEVDYDDEALLDSTASSGHKVSILGEESVHRGQWAGNVWRFPYLCYKNGGGAFLVVYALFFAFAAVPIFVMEVAVGQFLQRGETCNNYWNKKDICVETNLPVLGMNNTNATSLISNRTVESSVEQYWEYRVLKQTSSISDLGGIQWELLGLTFLSWAIVYFALWKGITQARKFVYFCAIFPYILIAVLLVRGLTLPGAGEGIKFYLWPNVTKFQEITLWKDAGTQVFYSYGVGFGTLIALGSHNRFYHNCFRDAILVCFINGTTSILAGFAIFSILGYMSFITGKEIKEIVKPGVGLAFQAYPEVASKLPFKQVWAFLFFLMITILGLDSQVCMLEGLFTALEDTFPLLLRKYKKSFLLVTCIIFFIIGIPMVSHSGAHWLTLVDSYGASGMALLFVVFFEVFGLAWGFGTHRVRDALYEMVGFYPPRCFTFLWKFTAPLSALVLFVLFLFMYEPLRYPNGEVYPFWAEAFGWFLSACSIVVIPGYMLYYCFNRNDSRGPFTRFRKGMDPPSELEI